MIKKQKNLLILGYGGFGKVVAETASMTGKWSKISFLDDQKQETCVLGKCEVYEKYTDQYTDAYPAFGNNALRLKWIEKLKEAGYQVPVMVHPQAYISPSASIEAGVIIFPYAVVQSYVIIKSGGIINIGALVDHDNVLEPGVHAAPGAIIKANNHIPREMKIEAGVCIQNAVFK